MAVKRTTDEIVDIVNHCVELEQAGGDILGYLWSQNYISPKATWFNFQREWLHRKPYEYTSGRPDERRQKKVMNTKQKLLTDEQRAECARLAIEGKDPKPYIASLGFKVPDGVWYNVKQWYKRNDPAVYEKIPKMVSGKKPVKVMDGKEYEKMETPEQAPTVKLSGPIRIETPEGNLVNVIETPEEPKAVKKINKPLIYEGMVVREIEGQFGRYRHSAVGDNVYIDFESLEQLDTLSLTVEQWRDFRKEQKHAGQILGVEL